MEEKMTFGLAPMKVEGGWATLDGRPPTPEQIAKHKEALIAERRYNRSLRGRLDRFFYKVGIAWQGLWSDDD